MSKQENKMKTVNGKVYVLYAGRWHIKVEAATPKVTQRPGRTPNEEN